MPPTTADLVDLGDLDGLLIRIDHLCADRDWTGVLDLRDRCRRAIERGRQLWPAASHAEYRLALEAPGPLAASVLVPGTGRFALGPLAEVAASTHAWADLRPHLAPTPDAAVVAHERVVRGEDLTGDPRVDPAALELPLRLQPWEPSYPLATYRAHTLEVADVPPPPMAAVGAAAPGDPVDDPEAVRALVELALPWKQESDGTVDAVAVEGDAAAAVAAVATLDGPLEGLRLGPVAPAGALAAMAWAAASGGAHGRRRGTAYGRFSAWWAVAAVAGWLDGWPLPADDLGAAAAALRWFRWDDGAPSPGWELRLAVEDRQRGRAWAVRARDRL